MSNRLATGNFPGAGALTATGKMFALGLDVIVGIFQRPFQTREFIDQCWFISRVCILPAALVSISFGSVISLQLGSLIRQFGAQSFSGAASTLAVIQQAAPVICALLVAGAGGSAICADLGARTIREEIDAMEVLGINPIQRLVVPRVLASILVSALLFGLVSIVGVAGGYYFNVVLQGVTPGAYVQGFSALSKPTDLLVGFDQGRPVRARRRDRRRVPRPQPRRRPEGRGRRGQPGRRHHVHPPVRDQRDRDGRVPQPRSPDQVLTSSTF